MGFEPTVILPRQAPSATASLGWLGSKAKNFRGTFFAAAKPPKATSEPSHRLAKAIARDYATVEEQRENPATQTKKWRYPYGYIIF